MKRQKKVFNQQKIALVIALILIIGAIIYIEINKPRITTIQSTNDRITIPLKDDKYPAAPELAGIAGYINTNEDLKILDLKGKVVLVDFWTYTCINCIRTFPFINEWDQKYRDKGLVIIGVHTPEFEFEKKYENVLNAVKDYGIKYAVVQDNDYATWRAYNNRFWPHKFLIDAEGFIRYDHIGEGEYDTTEEQIQKLLSEIGEEVQMPLSELEEKTPTQRQTPELYAGYKFSLGRGQNIGNLGGLQPGTINYILPSTILKDKIYLEGSWQANPENLQAKQKNATIILSFTAKAVNIVADSDNGALELQVLINGQPVSKDQAGSDMQFINGKSLIIIDEPKLYNIIDGDYGNYELKLVSNKEDFNFNAFTFG